MHKGRLHVSGQFRAEKLPFSVATGGVEISLPRNYLRKPQSYQTLPGIKEP